MRKNRLVKVVVTPEAHSKLEAAADKLKLPTSTLASLLLEALAGGYSRRGGFRVSDRNASGRIFRFRAGGGYG